MSRQWGATNINKPVWYAVLSKAQPACFSGPDSWASYLEAVHEESLDDESLRARLNRGQVPDICSDCTARHQRRMHTAGRCQPPPNATPPLLPIEIEA